MKNKTVNRQKKRVLLKSTQEKTKHADDSMHSAYLEQVKEKSFINSSCLFQNSSRDNGGSKC